MGEGGSVYEPYDAGNGCPMGCMQIVEKPGQQDAWQDPYTVLTEAAPMLLTEAQYQSLIAAAKHHKIKGDAQAEERWNNEDYWPPYSEIQAAEQNPDVACLCQRVEGAFGDGVAFAAFCMVVCLPRKDDPEFRAFVKESIQMQIFTKKRVMCSDGLLSYYSPPKPPKELQDMAKAIGPAALQGGSGRIARI